MKCFIDQNTLKTTNRINKIVLISCLSVCLTEYIFQIPSMLEHHLTMFEIIMALISTLCFYSLFNLLLLPFIDLVLLTSFYIENKIRYYFITTTFIFTFINTLPAYIILSRLLTNLFANFYLILTCSIIASLIIAIIFSGIIIYSYKDTTASEGKSNVIVAIILILIIIGTFILVKSVFSDNQLLSNYYMVLLILFYTITFFSLASSDNFNYIDKIQYKYLLIFMAVFIFLTTFTFNNNLKLSSYTKKYTLFEKNIISLFSRLLDFDNDGAGPEFLVAGGDIDNFNSKINSFAKDKPENFIDENIFNNDLNKIYYEKQEKHYTLPMSFYHNNIILITVNNFDINDIKSSEGSFLSNLINKSIFFPDSYCISSLKKVILNGILNSNLYDITYLKHQKPIIKMGEGIIDILNNNNYTTQVFIDIPYSAQADLFNIMNKADVIYANDYNLSNPIRTSYILDSITTFKGQPFFCWIYFDKRVPVDINKRIESIFENIKIINHNHKTILVVIFLPDNNSTNNNSIPATAPMLIYFNGVTPKVIKNKVSTADILPSLLTMLEIDYDVKSYIGRDISNYIFADNNNDRNLFFFDIFSNTAKVFNNNFELNYCLNDHSIELFNLNNDPDMKNNIINEKNNIPESESIFSWMDFYLSNGSAS
ncbi:MAG: hypothetical protein AB1782_15515 [Cyanobacteriota bacterium]